MPDRTKITDESPYEAVVGGDTAEQHSSTTAPSEDTGGSSIEPVETADAPAEEYVHPDVQLKLNPDKNLESPSFVQVASFPEVELSDSPKAVDYDHAQLLLSSDVVVEVAA